MRNSLSQWKLRNGLTSLRTAIVDLAPPNLFILKLKLLFIWPFSPYSRNFHTTKISCFNTTLNFISHVCVFTSCLTLELIFNNFRARTQHKPKEVCVSKWTKTNFVPCSRNKQFQSPLSTASNRSQLIHATEIHQFYLLLKEKRRWTMSLLVGLGAGETENWERNYNSPLFI